jgi:predicted acylesterase/phospholipase RssA
MSASTIDHLKPEDIAYLALEGGGGKGFAYLGALQLLDKHKVLDQIKGVAGTSAGAITALMISLRMKADEIAKKIDETDFTEFFDDPRPRLIPQASADPRQPGQYERRADLPEESFKLTSNLDPSAFDGLADNLQAASNKLGPGHLPGWIVWAGIAPMLRAAADQERTGYSLLRRALDGQYGPPVGKIAANWAPYFVYLQRDMGLFSGFAARNFLDGLIADRAAALNGGDPKDYRNMPFVVHQEIFKRELLVCGANLSTGKTELFSPRKEHTPNFPVADAVRISMSLPLIYKPYVFTKKIPGWPLCGTYVDGGLWNNLPLREIEPAPPAFRPAYRGQRPPSSRNIKKWPSQTLALRLELDPPAPVSSAVDVMTQMLKQVLGTGESQVLRELEYMCVTLDTSDLSLLQFKPEREVSETVTKRSRRAISRYFDWPIDKDDEDDEDDRKTKALSSASVCGG